MDEKETKKAEETPYVPRPRWQIIGAWVGLLLFLLGATLLYLYVLRLH